MAASRLNSRTCFAPIIFVVTLSTTLAGQAVGQSFPTRPLTLVVPSAAGVGPDLWARVLAEKMSPRLGQPIVVENKPGVGGLLGAVHVARSEPDGHTLLVTTKRWRLHRMSCRRAAWREASTPFGT